MSELTREDLLARECGALNGKLAGYVQVNERLEKELITFNRIIERLEKERDALKRLGEFAGHLGGCGVFVITGADCTCGLDAARAAVEGKQ